MAVRLPYQPSIVANKNANFESVFFYHFILPSTSLLSTVFCLLFTFNISIVDCLLFATTTGKIRMIRNLFMYQFI